MRIFPVSLRLRAHNVTRELCFRLRLAYAIFLLYQASVKSNSEMIFYLGITKENTKFLDLEKNVRDINLLRVTIRTLPYFELEKI